MCLLWYVVKFWHFCDIVAADIANHKAEVIQNEVIRYEDDRIVMFDAKFALCRYMWNIIPREHIESVKELSVAQLELLKYMMKKGVAVAKHIMKTDGHVFVEDFESEVNPSRIFCGYNCPPSVQHLQ